MDADRLAHFQGLLEDQRDQLTRQLAELRETDDTSSDGFDDNFADSGQVAAEVGENRQLALSLREQLGEVEHALAKIPDGTYGICEVSDQPIPEDRLEAMPATRVRVEYA